MRTLTRLLGFLTLVVATTSCGDVVRNGRAPVILVIDSLLGQRGAVTLGAATNPLISDVLTNVTSPAPCAPQSPCPTVFSDVGVVVLRLLPKDIVAPSGPSSNNTVTITRYHVAYRRADGRNTPGVDVPYAFDGAMTVTVSPGGASQFGFELVRVVAKQEPPLSQLVSNFTYLTLLADVTFYGRDLVGNEISAMGTIQIDIGNFGDF